MKKILVPTDFSSNAYNALFHAVQLVESDPCTFYLLNVHDEFTPLISKSSGKDLIQQLSDESHEGLKALAHRIKRDDTNQQHIFKTISRYGELTQIISKVVSEEDIDLVVMGNTGCSEVEAIFLGSNVLNTISAIKRCPVLTVPKEIDFVPPKQIAFVTDYHRPYDAGLLQPLLFLAKQYGAKICVMHINQEEVLDKYQTMNKSILIDYLSPFENSFHWMPLFKNKANSITTFLEELKIDILAMVNYEHSILERATREPVIKRVAFDLDIPFLVIPDSD